MKTIKTSLVSLFMLSSLAFGGGDIDPMEPEIATPEIVEEFSASGFYAGIGYSYIFMDNAGTAGDVTGNALTLQAGYNLHKYFAIEGRYSMTLGDLDVDNGPDNGDLSNIALFIKPQYSVEKFKFYGLLGYGQVSYDSGVKDYSEDGFQYGAGISLSATDTIDVYVDYTRLYDDDDFDGLLSDNITVDALNIGVNYKF